MSGYEASCPSCGATLVFALGSSLLRVCDHCGVAVARQGTNLANYGRVAELIPTASVLQLGLSGGYKGAPPFSLVGRLQLDYGAGTWDEWLLGFGNESWAWLSEAQGKFHYMGRAALPPVPAFDDLTVGQTIDLGPAGTFVVTEVRTARFMTAAGELPFDIAPGSLLRYADLSGPKGQFGTLDYGAGSTAEALYVGREVALDDLGFRGLPSAEDRRKKTKGESLSCPQCGGPLEIRAPDQTQRVACPYCGSLLDATKDLAVLQVLASAPVQPLIPLGSTGRFGGAAFTVIGFMERSVTVEGTRYPWREYLLYEASRGFRWLTESKGHWSFVEPLNAGDVRTSFAGSVVHQARTYKHFQSGTAQVDHVVGEFYWAVARGDRTETHDYIAPPLLLSKETTDEEITWSLGTYQEPDAVWAAFSLPGKAPEPEGVAANQPWPWAADSRAVYSNSLLLLSLVGVLFIVLSVLGGRTVHQEKIAIPAGAISGAPESSVFAGPIFVPSQGNLQVRIGAPVSNSWLYLEGALVNDETGEVDEFDAEVSYYSGRDSDGAWTEGSATTTRYLPSVPPGRYTLRLEPQWEAGKAPSGYELTVRNRVPRFSHAFLAFLAIGAWPLLVAWRHFRFEMQRWSESDHPWMEGSE